MCKEVIIIGAGGHGRVVADIVKKSGDKVLGFLDDKNDTDINVLGKINDCVKYTDKLFIIAIGNNKIRKEIAEKYPFLKYYTAIHPRAVIADNVVIMEGTCVMANAVINNSAKIGRHSIINTNATVEHDNILSDFVHVSPNAALCGTVVVGEGTHIGAGAVVRNNISITSDCVVGIGAAVVSNIEVSGVYIGVPARKEVK